MSNSAGDWISVAVLGRARGIKGEVTARSLSSKPERFARLKRVRLLPEGGAAPSFHDVEDVWEHGEVLVFKFAGISSMTDAEKLRGAEVQVAAGERVQLDPGEYFHSDLIGCEMRDRASGRVIGKVTDFQEYGGPALLEISGGPLLVPFVKEICVDIRPAEKLILVDLPDGLEDLANA